MTCTTHSSEWLVLLDWHGRNFNALNDSIESGGINRIVVLYVLVITNLDNAEAETFAMAEQFISFVREIESRGCPISIMSRKARAKPRFVWGRIFRGPERPRSLRVRALREGIVR